MGSEGASAHELLHVGISLRLVEIVALYELRREAIRVLDSGRLALGDL